MITVFLKTMSGDVLSVACPDQVEVGDFPLFCHMAMPEVDRCPLAFVRVLDADGMDVTRVVEGETYLLLIEDPEIVAYVYWEDDVLVGEPIRWRLDQEEEGEEGEADDWADGWQDYEAYLLRIVRGEDVMMEHLFYTPIAYVAGHKRYSNVYYHEDDVEVVHNPSFEARARDPMARFRECALRPGATAHYSPAVFGLTVEARYATWVAECVEEAWGAYVDRTGAGMFPVGELWTVTATTVTTAAQEDA